MTDEQRIASIWKNQPSEEITVNLSDLKNRAQSARDRVRLRNAILYLYSLLNIAASVVLIAKGYFPSMRYPMLLMIAAHLFVLWQVVSRVGGSSMPAGLAGSAVLDYLRQEFERQRKALSGAWLWFIAPFMPAFLWELAIWFGAIEQHWGTPAAAHALALFGATVAVAIVFWGTVWLLFALGARRWRLREEALERGD
jgi:hypothetical protein